MKISVGKIVVAVLLVLLIVTGVLSIKQRKSDNAEILKKVTVVSDGKINPANEGKLVLVCGEVDFYEIYLGELEEEQIDSFKIKRTVKDFVSYEKDGQTHYEWQERTEKKYNAYKPLDYLFTEDFKEETWVGEFVLDDYGMNLVPMNGSFDKKESLLGLKWNGMEYTSGGRDDPEDGDVSISYDYFDVDKYPYISILAKQKGDSFEPFQLGKTKVYSVFCGQIDSTDKLEDALGAQVKGEKRGRIALIVLIVAIAAIVTLDKKKNGSKSAKKEKADDEKTESTEPAPEPATESAEDEPEKTE